MAAEEDKKEEKGVSAAQIKALNDKMASNQAEVNQSMGKIADAIVNMQQNSILSKEPAKKETYEDDTTLGDISAKDFKADLLKEVSGIVSQTTTDAQTKQAKLNTTIADLSKDYPELQDNNNEVTKKFVEIHGALSKELQGTPEGYKMSALQAASSLGVLPMSKRQAAGDINEAFTLNPSDSSQVSRSKASKVNLPKETLDFAELMGVDMSNKDTAARVKEYATRPYGRYR